MTVPKRYEVQPSARRLIGSLRDIGYDFNTAIADLVDNSIEAGARHIQIDIRYRAENSSVTVSDDGCGMSESVINECLRFGSQRNYGPNDLGRYGLGLKTASLSQCARLSVVSRRSPSVKRISARQLDLDWINTFDRWAIRDPGQGGLVGGAVERLGQGPGTVVIWENLDRIFGDIDPNGGWAKRRLAKLALQAETYLGMVFHRFLSGEVPEREQLHISVNGQKVAPWDPFAGSEECTRELKERHWEVATPGGIEQVILHRYVLPTRELFSSPDEFERLGGPLKWNRQQGLYIYRSHRLIQSGGWCGIRTIDEHTKLARASLEFPSALDHLFRVNVAKMRVAVPAEVRTMLESPVHELCREADAAYRASSTARGDGPTSRSISTIGGSGLAVRAAALAAGVTPSQMRAFESHLRTHSPEVAAMLGL